MSDEKLKESDELFDKLSEQLSNVAEALTFGANNGYVIPTASEIKELWDGVNRELQDLEKIKQADFLIKKGNEFYFIGMYLKAAFLMETDRRTSILSGASSAENMGDDGSFIKKGYKQLKKRTEQ